jgi:FXSXX-COOH protein
VPCTDSTGVAQPIGEPLPSLTGTPLMDLLGTTETALANAVRRMVRETDRAEENYAAFGSSLPPDGSI